MDFKLNKSKKRKRTMAISVESNGQVTVHAPVWTNTKDAQKFVDQNSNWIKKQQQKLLQNPKDTSHIYYLGQKYIYDFNYHSKAKPRLVVKSGVFTFFSNDPHNFNDNDKTKLLEKFYKAQAKKVIPGFVNKYCELTGKNYNKITIKNVSTRWGSCSIKGNLNFNYRLMQTPIHCVEYVVAHEVCHLTHHNHSKKFWDLVEKVFPNFKECEKHLKQNQHLYL